MRELTVNTARAALWLALVTVLAGSACTFGVDPNGVAHFSCTKQADCGDGFECRPQKGSDKGLCYQIGECEDAETKCDGKDEDCNGVVDDVDWLGNVCESNHPGICHAGHRTCVDTNAGCEADTSGTAEVCNGLDDDCDGMTDEDFAFATDNEHCGACDVACGSGSSCQSALCVEMSCADGVDNDGDGLADCNDADCFDQACSETDPMQVCGLLPPMPESDGGMDAGFDDGGFADAGTGDAGLDDGGFEPGPPDAGLSDAGDFLIPQCVPRESDCANAIDDDGDLKVDCDDPDCSMSAACTDAGIESDAGL